MMYYYIEYMYMYRNLGNVRVNNLRVKKLVLKYFRGWANHGNLAHKNLLCTVFCCWFYILSEKSEDSKMPVFMVIYRCTIKNAGRWLCETPEPTIASVIHVNVWNSPRTSASVLLFAEGSSRPDTSSAAGLLLLNN